MAPRVINQWTIAFSVYWQILIYGWVNWSTFRVQILLRDINVQWNLGIGSSSMCWLDLRTEVAVLNSQVVPIYQVVLKTSFTVFTAEFGKSFTPFSRAATAPSVQPAFVQLCSVSIYRISEGLSNVCLLYVSMRSRTAPRSLWGISSNSSLLSYKWETCGNLKCIDIYIYTAKPLLDKELLSDTHSQINVSHAWRDEILI